MTKSEIPKGCYGYVELRDKLQISHKLLLAIIGHPECPIAGQYQNATHKNRNVNFYKLSDIKKFIKTGKQLEIRTKAYVLQEWEIPTHSPAERLISQRAKQFYKLMAGSRYV